MASTQKLPSGKFRGVYRDSDNQRRYTPAVARKSDAREAAVDAEARARRQAATTSGSQSAGITWGEWWEVFSTDREFDSDSGLVEERNVRLYVRPRWGDVPLNKIARRDVQAWVDQLSRGKSPSYVQRIYSTFSASITAALDREVLLASPTAGVKLPRRRKQPKPFVSPQEAEIVVAQLPVEIADAVAFALETGLRPGELTGLHAHRLDLERGWMTVAEAYVFRRKAIRGWPKDREPRVIPLTSKAIDIARRRLEGRDLRAGCGVEHISGQPCRHPLVFLSPTGRPLNRDLLSAHLRDAAGRAETDPRSGYALRRGFATRLGAAGLDVFELQRLMGHSDVNLTSEYVQQTDDARARTLAALGERQPLREVPVIQDRARDTDVRQTAATSRYQRRRNDPTC